MDAELLDLLRADLDASGYSLGSVASLWGNAAESSRQRGVHVPARRALVAREASPLATLAKLFLFGDSVGVDEISCAFPALGAGGAVALGLVEATSEGRYRAILSLNPISLPDPAALLPGDAVNWYVLSDLDDQLRNAPARPDHVMGVGGATRSLLAQAPFGHQTVLPGLTALDLGTGCGVVAMYLARAGASRIVATDISDRALMLARANAQLNGMAERIEFRQGDLFQPVSGEQFGLILSNPPFVITPRGDDEKTRYEYRDGGLTGDELAAKVVREAPIHLEIGGVLLCLANWEVPWGGDGLARVGGWIEDASRAAESTLDAWVIERDRVDPVQYAETWARDGGARPGTADFDALMTGWLNDFEARKIVGVGLGSIRVRRAEVGAENVIRREQSLGMFASDGPGIALSAAFYAGSRVARMTDAEMLADTWLVHPRVIDEREHQPGAEAPNAIHLVIDTPIGQRIGADPLLTAALGVCDGDLTLAQIAGAIAQVLEVDEAEASAALIEGFRELVWLGMVAPAPR